jgi:hypothetical protein
MAGTYIHGSSDGKDTQTTDDQTPTIQNNNEDTKKEERGT